MEVWATEGESGAEVWCDKLFLCGDLAAVAGLLVCPTLYALERGRGRRVGRRVKEGQKREKR